MNERIRELAEQAGMEFVKTMKAWLADNKDIERFAELVRQDEQEPWDTSDMAHRSGGLSVDMSTKEQNSDTSEERVHETDKSIHEDDDIQEYKRPWVGLSDLEVGIYNHQFNCTRLVRDIEALLRERNT